MPRRKTRPPRTKTQRRSSTKAVRTSTSPITHEYNLQCSAEDAFTTYTRRIGEWWDPRYTANAETIEVVTIEPRVGGRVYATHRDTGDDDWGTITVWEPGRKLVHTFTLAQDPMHPSEVAVEFVSGKGTARATPGCKVRFAHGGWTKESADARKKFADWRIMLDRFAALANASGAGKRVSRHTDTIQSPWRKPPE